MATSAMTELYIFASTFAVVMLLGLQSLNVNGGHHIAAFTTSFGIGTANLVLFKLVPDASVTEMLAYLLGGPFGILLAMWIHPRLVLLYKRRSTSRTFKTAARGRANLNCGADRP
jgi:hypothetical protein